MPEPPVIGFPEEPDSGRPPPAWDLGALPPGATLARRAEQAASAGLSTLGDDQLVDLLCASRRLASWAASLELDAAGELDRRRMAAALRPGSSRASEHVSDELAAALVLTSRSADALLGLARQIARMPAVAAALRTGRIDLDRARVFAAELADLDDRSAAAVAMAFARAAGAMTTGQLRAALRAMVLALDATAARRRAQRAREQARVEYWPEGSGNAGLAGRELSEADAIAADARISAIARALRAAGTPGTMDQLRAAVFTALLAGRDPAELAPPAQRPGGDADSPGDTTDTSDTGSPGNAGDTSDTGSPGSGAELASLAGTVHLTMPMSTWLGLTDTPGEVPGRGTLRADTCRDLAARLARGPATRWCLTFTGPDGRAVAHACAPPRFQPGPPRGGSAPPPTTPGDRPPWPGPLTITWLAGHPCTHAGQEPGYRPGNLLRHLVKVRQRSCSYPGCRRPATRCDLDHTIPWDAGGLTCECNLAPMCRRHHRAKQAPGWHVTQPRPGTLAWTLPHGRTYTTTPAPYLI